MRKNVNFGRAYVDYATKLTDAPAMFHTFAVPAICGAALGNRVYVETGWGRIHPSPWVCFIGRSMVRKSTAVNMAVDLLNEAAPGIELPYDFSREAFYEHLAQQPAGILRWREMGSVLDTWNLDYMRGVSSTLTDFWDNPSQVVRELKGSGIGGRKRIVIHRPAITILAASKPAWFAANVKSRDLEGGFIGRWLFVAAERNEGRRPFFKKRQEDHEVRDSLVAHLKELAKVEGRVDTSSIGDSLDGWLAEFEASYEQEPDGTDPADFAGRAGTQVIKLAMGIQASFGAKGTLVLEPDSVKIAIDLFTTALWHGRKLTDDIQGAGWAQSIFKRLEEKMGVAGGEIAQRDLVRAMTMTLDKLEPYLKTKLATGEWVMESRTNPTGGRATIIYRSAPKDTLKTFGPRE